MAIFYQGNRELISHGNTLSCEGKSIRHGPNVKVIGKSIRHGNSGTENWRIDKAWPYWTMIDYSTSDIGE